MADLEIPRGVEFKVHSAIFNKGGFKGQGSMDTTELYRAFAANPSEGNLDHGHTQDRALRLLPEPPTPHPRN